MIRVFIADDHAVVREGLQRIIANTDGLRVTGEAANGAELLERIATHPCDVVLMDLAMPGLPGLEVLREVRRRHPRIPVLVLSMHSASQYAVRALAAGAAGYLDKGRAPSELITALRTVAAGRRYLTDEVAECLAEHLHREPDQAPHTALSNREFQVLCLLGAGRSVTEIARDMGLSVKTISTFRSRLLTKLGLRRTAELVRYALEHGLVQ